MPLLLALVTISVLALTTERAFAVGTAADAFCGAQYCAPGKCVPGPNHPCPPCQAIACSDVTSLFTSTGFCQNSIPGLCVGTGTNGPNGFGLNQVAQILGPLMSALMQGSQNGSASPDTTLPASCQTQTPTGVATQLTGAPVATLTITVGNSAAVTGSTTVGTATLSALPASGSAPLSVTFSTQQAGTLDFGDGQNTPVTACTADSSGNCSTQTTHVYTIQGTYTATLSTVNNTASGACDYGTPSFTPSSLLGTTPTIGTSLTSALSGSTCSDPTTCGLSSIASQLTSTVSGNDTTGSLIPIGPFSPTIGIAATSSPTSTQPTVLSGGYYQGTGSTVSPQGLTLQRDASTIVFNYLPVGSNSQIAGFISCGANSANVIPYVPLSAIQNYCQ
jgi:hypothetical protein